MEPGGGYSVVKYRVRITGDGVKTGFAVAVIGFVFAISGLGRLADAVVLVEVLAGDAVHAHAVDDGEGEDVGRGEGANGFVFRFLRDG